jgi:hypothetical protein
MLEIRIETRKQAEKFFEDWDLDFMGQSDITLWTPITITPKAVYGRNPNVHSCNEELVLTYAFNFKSALETAYRLGLEIVEI